MREWGLPHSFTTTIGIMPPLTTLKSGGACDLHNLSKIHKRLQQATEYLMNTNSTGQVILMTALVSLFNIAVALSNAHALPSIPRSKLLVVLLESPGLPVCDLEMASKVIDGATQQVSPAVRLRTELMTIPHPFPELNTLANKTALATSLLILAKRDPRFSRHRVHFLTPALVGPGGEWYSYEMGSSQCAKRAVSVGSCIEYNDLGQNRVIASVFAAAHGMLHGHGVTHIYGINIMDPDALPYSVEYNTLPVKKRTKREVRECIRK